MSMTYTPPIGAVQLVAARTPGQPTSTLWYRAVATELRCTVATARRLCKAAGIVPPPNQGKRTYYKDAQ